MKRGLAYKQTSFLLHLLCRWFTTLLNLSNRSHDWSLDVQSAYCCVPDTYLEVLGTELVAVDVDGRQEDALHLVVT